MLLDQNIESSWKNHLSSQFESTYFKNIAAFLEQEIELGKIIYPPKENIFQAFSLCPFDELKVVILGQDPYHGPGEAHGLCFSVLDNVKIPPSLRNIFKEMNADLKLDIPSNGNLSAWAKQGVFMLNAILSVEHKSPASHKGIGWEIFTNEVIKCISEHRERVVFILWGAFAKTKKALINQEKHLIIESAHPAAEIYAGGKAGFFGSRPFSQCNKWLLANKMDPINWNLNKG